MDAFEIGGYWWLPEHSTRRAAGVLTFSPVEGPQLRLLDRLPGAADDLTAYPVIHGVTEEAKPVTLVNCLEGEHTIRYGRGGGTLHTSRVSASYAVIGQHFASVDEVKFTELRVGFDRLADWFRRSGIENRRSFDAERDFLRFEAIYSDGPRYEFALSTMRLRLTGYVTIRQPVGSLRWDEVFWVELEPNEPLAFAEFARTWIPHLRRFLSFGLGTPVHVTRLRAYLPRDEEAPNTLPVDESPVEILIGGEQPAIEQTTVRASGVLYRFTDVEDGFQRLIQDWYATMDLLEPVYQLYFGALLAPEMYLETRFLVFMQALEAFHRRTRSGTFLPDRTADEIRQKLEAVIDRELQKLPDELHTGKKIPRREIRQAFKSKVKYINQYSQRRRLKELIRELGPVTDKIIPDCSTFVDQIVATRNHHTHFDEPERGQHIIPLEQLPLTVSRLGFLIEMHLLRRLNFPEVVIERAIEQRARDILEERVITTFP